MFLSKKCFLAGLLVLGYVVLLAAFSISEYPQEKVAKFGWPYLFDKPVGEDGFYMLQVAWNTAQGNWFSDPNGKVVTGVQPLVVFLYASVAKLTIMMGGGKDLFVRLIILVNGLLLVMYSHFMGAISARLLRTPSTYGVGFTLAAFSFFCFRVFTYGLETGLYLVLFSLFVLYLMRLSEGHFEGPVLYKEKVILGILIGVLGLARIDFGVIFAVFLIIFTSLYGFRATLKWALPGLIGLALVLCWFIFCYVKTGTPMPSSGPAQASMIGFGDLGVRIKAGMLGLLQVTVPFLFNGGRWELGLLQAPIFFMSVVFLKKRYAALPATFIYLLSASIFLSFLYPVFFWAGHFYSRYMSVLMVFTIPILANLVSEKQFFRKRYAPALIVIFFSFSLVSLHSGRIGNLHSLTAGWVKKEHPDKLIAAFQSGVIGFVNDAVVNLDGKVNADVLSYVEAGDITQYLISHPEIDVIVDWPMYIEKYINKEYFDGNWVVCLDESKWGSRAYCRLHIRGDGS